MAECAMPRSFHSFSSTAFARVLAVAHGQDAGEARSKPPLMASVPKGSDPPPSALAISGAGRCAPAHLPEALGRRAIAVVGGQQKPERWSMPEKKPFFQA